MNSAASAAMILIEDNRGDANCCFRSRVIRTSVAVRPFADLRPKSTLSRADKPSASCLASPGSHVERQRLSRWNAIRQNAAEHGRVSPDCEIRPSPTHAGERMSPCSVEPEFSRFHWFGPARFSSLRFGSVRFGSPADDAPGETMPHDDLRFRRPFGIPLRTPVAPQSDEPVPCISHCGHMHAALHVLLRCPTVVDSPHHSNQYALRFAPSFRSFDPADR